MKATSRILPSFVAVLALTPLMTSLAAPPPVPANVRAVILPAEVVLTWDASAGADHYRIYRADLDLRWMPIATDVAVPRYRDADFRALPCHYQIAACNAAGECAATAVFTVNSASASISLIGANTRPLSDTSVALSWTILGDGGGDAMLEVGTSLNSLELVGANAARAPRHDFNVVNLAPNTAYFYRLTSAGANGAGFTYIGQFATRPYTAPPPVVVNVTGFPMFDASEDVPVDFTLTADFPGPLTFFIPFIQFGTILGTPPNLTYVSGPEHTGLDFFDVGVSDGVSTFFATVFVNVNVVQDPPIALDRSMTFAEDGGGKFRLEATAWDSNPVNVDCVIVDGPTNGVLTKVPFEKMSVEYIPNPNFNGVDHFTFRCFDGQRAGNVATVRLRVTPVNDAPVANPQAVTVAQNTPQVITLNASDSDGDQLTFTVVTPPAHGTLSGPTPNLTGQFTYAPAAGYSGPDSFTWQVTDPSGGSATATVSIDVVRVNQAPMANGASVSTVSGVPVNVTLTGSDPDGDALTFSVVTAPAHGALSGTVPNLVYTSDAGYTGADSYTFKANDGQVDSAPATVSINVVRGNAAPTANPASVSTVSGVAVNMTLTGSDPDGDALTFNVLMPPSHGTLSGTAPNLVYTPNAGFSGADSFTFKANDGQADSAPATVSLSVGPASDIPSNLAGVAVSRSQVNLTWTDNSGRETGYQVESSSNGNKWKVVATLGANATSYTDTEAHGPKMLYYRVRAVLGAGYSDYSNVASVSMR
jgi:hypothetical protein